MKISKQSLAKLKIRGAISTLPPSQEDQEFLDRLEKVWGDADLLRHQLSIFTKKRRERIIDTCTLLHNWERWAYTRFYNDKGAYGHTSPRREDVFIELKNTFKIDEEMFPDEYIKNRLISIQRKARREKRER